MTDKEWGKLLNKRGARRIVCMHPKGNYCTAYRDGKCIALHNTRFTDRPCPFFRDTTTMADFELEKYYSFVDSLVTSGQSAKKGESDAHNK